MLKSLFTIAIFAISTTHAMETRAPETPFGFFGGLPDELNLRILSFLDLKKPEEKTALINFAQTCTRAHNLSIDRELLGSKLWTVRNQRWNEPTFVRQPPLRLPVEYPNLQISGVLTPEDIRQWSLYADVRNLYVTLGSGTARESIQLLLNHFPYLSNLNVFIPNYWSEEKAQTLRTSFDSQTTIDVLTLADLRRANSRETLYHDQPDSNAPLSYATALCLKGNGSELLSLITSAASPVLLHNTCRYLNDLTAATFAICAPTSINSQGQSNNPPQAQRQEKFLREASEICRHAGTNTFKLLDMLKDCPEMQDPDNPSLTGRIEAVYTLATTASTNKKVNFNRILAIARNLPADTRFKFIYSLHTKFSNRLDLLTKVMSYIRGDRFDYESLANLASHLPREGEKNEAHKWSSLLVRLNERINWWGYPGTIELVDQLAQIKRLRKRFIVQQVVKQTGHAALKTAKYTTITGVVLGGIVVVVGGALVIVPPIVITYAGYKLVKAGGKFVWHRIAS